MGYVIVIDDDEFFRDVLADHCQRMNHEAAVTGTVAEGMALLRSRSVDLVFLDVCLPDGNGLEALPMIQQHPSSPEVIIVTGMGSAQGAELAIKSGAWDYLQKPVSGQDIILHIKRAMEYHCKKTTRPARVHLQREEIIGSSAPILACLDQVAHCTSTEASVLLTGETGTGKELFARAIHANSTRSHGPFVVVDCAALPETLVESTLFGHVKGAFTGADKARRGLIEQAHGGTLFLDEVGELPVDTQRSFLRVLQERRFRPIGGDREVESDFRLVAATNRNLQQMVTQERFRSDLFYRLSTVVIQLPPLRDRPKDIPALTMTYTVKLCQRNRLIFKGVLPETLEMLASYPWPGNVRELINALEKAIIFDPANPTLYPRHFPPEIRLYRIRRAEDLKVGPCDEGTPPEFRQTDLSFQLPPLKEFRRGKYDEIEKGYLFRLMSDTTDDMEKACRISGLSRSRLYGLLKHHKMIDSSK